MKLEKQSVLWNVRALGECVGAITGERRNRSDRADYNKERWKTKGTKFYAKAAKEKLLGNVRRLFGSNVRPMWTGDWRLPPNALAPKG